jgi:rhodanese-related sulfurtransferase
MKFFSLIFVCSFLSCTSAISQVQDTIKFTSLPPMDFQKAFQEEEKALLIDVREFFEFKKKRLKGAVNIPSSGNIELAADTLNKESALFLYCTTGFRSKRVAKSFYDQGFRKLYSLDGGIAAWKKEGIPVDKKRLKAHD